MKSRSLLLVALVACAALVSPAPARAGEYPVHACDPAFGDVNHSWLPESNNPKMVAYANCPVPWTETRVWNQGLVARSTGPTSGATTVPGFAYAAMRMRAPPGAVLSRITFEHSECSLDGFVSGLIDGGRHWLEGSFPTACGSFFPSPYTFSLGGTSSVAGMTICSQATCKLSSPLGGWATLRSATVWVSDSTRPSVAISGGSLAVPGWHRGIQSLAATAHDNVGIKSVNVYLDGRPVLRRSGSCNWTVVAPCATSLGSLYVDSRDVGDGGHTLGVAATDSAGNVGSAARRVLIDNTAPTGPLGLQTFGGESWRSANRFAVEWINPPQAGMAPIAGVRYAICPAANAIDDFARCSRETRVATSTSVLHRIAVPGSGDWVGRFWLEDAAGNQDRRTAQPVHLRYDGEAPAVAFRAPDAADPQRITIAASDALSGVAGVEVEIRRAGAPAWISLPVSRAETNLFIARVDDAVLPAGRYAVRARARDGAGNERSTSTATALDLPLRVRTSLAVGRTHREHGRHGGHAVLLRSATVPFGHRVRLRGQLSLPGPNPLAFSDVEVFEQTALPNQPWRRIGVVRTDRRGAFTYRTTPGPSRTLRFSYAGTPLIQPRSRYVRLRVRAATSFHVNRRHVVNGDEVVFGGRVRGRLPRSGKLLQLQAYSRGDWRTFATPRAHARGGRWHYDYRFSATRGLVRYRFRAVIPREAGFPYARGASRHIQVTVRGL